MRCVPVLLLALMKCLASAFSVASRRAPLGVGRLSCAVLLSNGPVSARSLSDRVEVATASLSVLTRFEIELANAVSTDSDLLLIPVFEPSVASDAHELPVDVELPTEVAKVVQSVLQLWNKPKGSDNYREAPLVAHVPVADSILKVAFLKLANKQSDTSALTVSQISEQLGSACGSLISREKVRSVSLLLPAHLRQQEMLLSLHGSLYQDTRFKGTTGDKASVDSEQKDFQRLRIVGSEHNSVAADAAAQIASGVALAKDIVGAPANWKTPERIAKLTEEFSREFGLECTVLGQEECEKRGMGSYLAVQQGSRFAPHFLHLTYRGKRSSNDQRSVTKIALVGKGLTFDSGGYNLKAGAGSMIELMKFDVGGAAAVLGCAKAIAQLQPEDLEVHFIAPLCENMISAEAMRPGDIVKASNGKTIEIINTDAEGRLALADALVYAEQLNVNAIVDVATLTGACIMGLGEKIGGLYANSESLRNALCSAAQSSGESLWAMPLEKGYAKSIKSTIADLKNLSSNKGGGSITAALFLQEFVKNTPWAHLDIAGPVWDTTANKPTGFAVKTLVNFLLSLSKADKTSFSVDQ